MALPTDYCIVVVFGIVVNISSQKKKNINCIILSLRESVTTEKCTEDNILPYYQKDNSL